MKFIYQLKDSATRAEFVKRPKAQVGSSDIYSQLLAFVCFIKDDDFINAELIFDQVTASEDLSLISRERILHIYEVVAVLWAQRELAHEVLSIEQALCLKRLFDFFGGTHVFLDKRACSPHSINIARYEKTAPPRRKHIHIFFRDTWWSDQISRPHELGVRLKNSFETGGWSVDLRGTDAINDDLATLKRGAVVLLDVDKIGISKCLSICGHLPKDTATIGMVSDYHHLRHNQKFDQIQELASRLTILWTSTEDQSQHVELTELGNWTDFPIPLGVNERSKEKILSERTNADWLPLFVGSIERNCLPRIVFLVESTVLGNMNFDISSHLAEGLSAESGFEDYLRRLTCSRINLNFSRRYNGTSIRTGRIIEAIATGGLLLHDYCPLVPRWFNENEHFIGFSDENDLPEIIEQSKRDLKGNKTIAIEATHFYEQNYSPLELTKHFSSFL